MPPEPQSEAREATADAPVAEAVSSKETTGDSHYERKYRDAVTEAKKAKAERNSLKSKLEKLEKAEREAEEAKAKEQGEYKSLLDKAEQQLGSGQSAFLRSELVKRVIAKGVPADMAELLNYDASGLKVSDRWELEGDVDSIVDGLVAPLQNFLEQKPKGGQPATVIKERANDEKLPPSLGIKAWGQKLSDKNVLG